MVKYTQDVLEKAAKKSKSIAEVMRRIGIKKWAGGTHTHIRNRLRDLGIDTSHFTGQAHGKGKKALNRLEPKHILVKREAGRRQKRPLLERALIESGAPYECAKCGLEPEWEGEELTLPVDHINGNFLDDREENLRFLCPNCHSQTETFSNRKRAE